MCRAYFPDLRRDDQRAVAYHALLGKHSTPAVNDFAASRVRIGAGDAIAKADQDAFAKRVFRESVRITGARRCLQPFFVGDSQELFMQRPYLPGSGRMDAHLATGVRPELMFGGVIQ